jgi:hypothetical protein
MLASRLLVPLVVLAVLVVLALLGLWLASRAPMPDTSADMGPVPSNQLRELVEAAVDIAKTVAISSGQDVAPASITENGAARTRAHAGYLDAALVGANGVEVLTAADYRSSVDLGFRSLAAQDDDRAVLIYSGRVQHEQTKTDAILLEAYERDGPVTFRFAQPYRIDQVKQTGTLEGPLFRLADGPPHFTQTPASRHG